MALTITLERKERIGALKMFIFKVVDSDSSGGTLAMGNYLSHIFWVGCTDLTTAVFVSTIWTDGSEDITIGGEATAADTLKVIVIGS